MKFNPLIYLVILLVFISCQFMQEKSHRKTYYPNKVDLKEVASSKKLWTGLTISKSGRLFANYPRWSPDIKISVVEIVDDQLIPYPDSSWNDLTDMNSEMQFVCVQSVYVDNEDKLWVLDPSISVNGVVERGPRLYKFELSNNTLVRSYSFPDSLIFQRTYLNDVRVDTDKDVAYITDSGLGGIYVVDLKDGSVKRCLDSHYSVKAETDSLVFEDNVLRGFEVHSDGIALSNDNKWLYYLPLSGYTLYRIPTDKIMDENASIYVEKVAAVYPCDGMLFDSNGILYLAGLESNSIYTIDQDHKYEKLLSSEYVKWADSFTKDPEGLIYFTTSQLHVPFPQKSDYKIYKLISKKIIKDK